MGRTYGISAVIALAAASCAAWEQRWPELDRSDRKLMEQIYAPTVVGVQPIFAHRDLCLCSDGEIRHYGHATIDGKETRVYVSSRNWGLNWKTVICEEGDVGPMTRSPWSGDFVTLGWEPRYWGPYYGVRSKIGPGDTHPEKCALTAGDFGQLGFYRLPLPMTTRRRWYTTGLDPYLGTDKPDLCAAFAWSDDDGRTWRKSRALPNVSTAGKLIGGDRMARWNNYCCEPTAIELRDGSLYMIARTSFNHPVAYRSKDGGETWTGPEEVTWLWLSNTIPTFFRLRDGRLILFWNNTEPYPKPDPADYPGRLTGTEARGVAESVFTNRDAFHAAISEDDGRTWIGFREILLNPIRNREDFRELGYDKSNDHDKSVQQAQALELPNGKVLLAVGQGRDARRLMIFDPKWLYETELTEDFIRGTEGVSTHLFVKSCFGSPGWGQGHCAWNRVAGPVLAFEPDPPTQPGTPIADGKRRYGARDSLHMTRVDDPRLINSRQGVVWNFPAARKGSVEIDCRLEGGEGFRLTLSDHWFNPSDEYAPTHSSVYTIPVRPDAVGAKAWKTLRCEWDCDTGAVKLAEGARTLAEGRLSRVPPFGVCYLHLQILADREDRAGVYFRAFRKR